MASVAIAHGVNANIVHGWRKVAPDTRHPKSDPLTQEQWKKNSPMCWIPSSIPQRSVADESA